MSALKRSRTASFGGMSQLSTSTGLTRKRISRPKPVGRRRPSTKGKLTAAKVRTIARQVIRNQQETKYFDSFAASQSIGQTTINSSGHSLIQMGLTPQQGSRANERIGDAIIAESITINSQFRGQQFYGGGTVIKSYVVAFFGMNPNIGDFLDPNIFIAGSNSGNPSIYDVNCMRNPDYLQTVKVLAQWTTKVPIDAALAVNAVSVANISNQVVIPLKDLRMEYDASTGAHSNVSIAIISLADAGNNSATNGSLANVVTNSGGTGVLFSHASRMTYRDA